MMRQFPTGFTINGEEKAENDVLRIMLPTKNGEIVFKKNPARQQKTRKHNTKEPRAPSTFGVSIIDNAEKKTRKICDNAKAKECKEIMEYIFMPHKDIDMKTIMKEIRKKLRKKKKQNDPSKKRESAARESSNFHLIKINQS